MIYSYYYLYMNHSILIFFFQAEDGIRDYKVTGVQTCALPIWAAAGPARPRSRAGSSGRWARCLPGRDRKSIRLNSSHLVISYAVFCLKKKKKTSQRESKRPTETKYMRGQTQTVCR